MQPDMMNEIAAIQVATTGSELRSAIANALSVLNDMVPSQYEGPYIVAPSIDSVILSLSGYLMNDDLTIEAFPVSYYSGSYVISPSTSSLVLDLSGYLMSSSMIIKAFSRPVLISKTVSYPGEYRASADHADGYSVFNVVNNIYSGTFVIYPGTEHDIYIDTSRKYCSEDFIVKSVPIGSVHFSSNGIYTADSYSLRGFSYVTVDVPATMDYSNVINRTFGVNSFNFSTYSSIGAFAFGGCDVGHVTFDNCTDIGPYAFASCYQLFTAEFNDCITIGSHAFEHCGQLGDLSFPSCQIIGESAFAGCFMLSSISFPECTEIHSGAFKSCDFLSFVYMPQCSFIGDEAFAGCTMLSESPNLTNCLIGDSAFLDCQGLSWFGVTGNGTSSPRIGKSAFYGCSNLSMVTIGTSIIPDLGSGAFDNTLITTSSLRGIYVPQSLYSDYLSHSQWASYSSYITYFIPEM